MDKDIKVCHVSSAHKNDDLRILKKECTSLVEEGYDVCYVARGVSFDYMGVKIIGAGYPKKGLLNRSVYFSKKVYKVAKSENCDIYHLHDPELLRFALKLKRAGKLVIFDSHECYGLQISEKQYIPRFFRAILKNIYTKWESRICRQIDAVISVCTIDGRSFFEGRSKLECHVPNYPFFSEAIEMHDDSAFLSHEFTAIYVGALTDSRGITQLIQACDLAAVHLVLCGSFNTFEFEARIKAMPEYSCVEYLGELSHDITMDEIGKASIGMLTLLDHGQYFHADTFATKVLEYMEKGIPVIVPNTKFYLEQNNIYNFGICVDTQDFRNIAKAIIHLKNNPELARKMGRNGYALVKDELNWDNAKHEIIELYFELGKRVL